MHYFLALSKVPTIVEQYNTKQDICNSYDDLLPPACFSKCDLHTRINREFR